MTEHSPLTTNDTDGTNRTWLVAVLAVILVGFAIAAIVFSGRTVGPGATTDGSTAPGSTGPADATSTTSGDTSTSAPSITSSTAPDVGATTDAPVVVDPTTAPSTDATTSTTVSPPVLRTKSVVAITASGDAVFFPAGGEAPILLFDGPDPDAPPPEEGPAPNSVDAVAVTPDGSIAFIGTCCEPVSGAILQTAPPTLASYENGLPLRGYAPAVSPNGKFLSTGSIPAAETPISVMDIESGDFVEVVFDGDTDTFTSFDTMWLDDSHLGVIGTVLIDSAQEWVVFPVAFDGTTATVGEQIVFSPDEPDEIGAKTWQFAGTRNGTDFAVHHEDLSTLLSIPFDGDLSSFESFDVDEPALRVWVDPVRPTIVVHVDGSLHIGDAVIPGDYVWARY